MTTPHSPATPSGAAGRPADTFSGSKRLQRLTCNGFRSFLTAFSCWKLKRLARSHLGSFFRIAETNGLSPYSSRHSKRQTARLRRIRQITTQLRNLRFTARP